MSRSQIADDISREIKMIDVINKYTDFEIRKSRIPCPFHNGEDYNLSFNDDVFRCFVCDTSGNIFSFIMKLFGLDFFQAVQKIRYDFNLNLPNYETKNSMRYRIQAAEAEKKRREEVRKSEEEKRKKTYEHERIGTIWALYDFIISNYKPLTTNEELDPFFVSALQNIKYYEYLLGLSEAKRGAKVG